MNWWIRQKLRAKQPRTRLRALEQLIDSEKADTAMGVIQALSDPDGEIRRRAAEYFARTREEQAVPHLIDALRDRDPEVRAACASALRHQRSNDAVPHLLRALHDSHPPARYHAARALEVLSWQPADEEELAWFTIASGDLEAAPAHGTAAIAPLMLVLKTSAYYKRLQAVEALSRIRDPQALKPLVDALKDDDGSVRTAAVEALGFCGDARAVEPLIAILRDPDPRVRAAAVDALSRHGDHRAIDPLTRILRAPEWEVRSAAIEALGRFPDPRILPGLTDCLADPDPQIRRLAAGALGRARLREAIPTIVGALADPEETVRTATAAALNRIDSEWMNAPETRKGLPRLREQAASEDYWTQHSAAEWLERLGAAKGDVATPARVEDPRDKRDAAVRVFMESVNDRDRDVRLAAIEALGRIGATDASNALIPALDDADPWVQYAAARALDDLYWDPEDDRIRARQLILLGKWEGITPLGTSAIGPLVTATRPDQPVHRRLHAIEALSRIDDPRIPGILAEHLADDDPEIRTNSAAALTRLQWKGDGSPAETRWRILTGDWDAVARLGPTAVAPLAETIQRRFDGTEDWLAAESALSRIERPDALPALLEITRNPEVARPATTAILEILRNHGPAVSTPDLNRIASLDGITQVRYEYDTEAAVCLPSGIDPVDVRPLVDAARRELARRSPPTNPNS